jgi:capsular exopolysaccharide synthesis family protein
MTQYELNIRDYWRIVRRRKRVILLSGILLALLSFLISDLKAPTPEYQSTASVKVERSSTMTGLFMEMLTWSPMDNIATQTSVIRSYPVLMESAVRLGLLPEGLSPDETRNDSNYLGVVSKLQSEVTTEQEGNTNIINITVTSQDPESAQNAANTVAEVYRDQNVKSRNRQTTEVRKFIESQRSVVGERLINAEEELKRYRQSTGVLDISEEVRQLMSRIAQLEGALDDLRRRMDEAVMDMNNLKQDKALLEPGAQRLFTETTDSLLYKLSDRLLELRLKKEELFLTYLPEHPMVMEVESQINNVKSEMINELSVKLDAYSTKAGLLERDINNLKSQLGAAPESGLALARMEREVQVNADLFSQLQTKYQEALIKESEKIEEVSIIRPAMAPAMAVNPPMKLAHTMLGVGVGLLLGLVLAFVLESVDTSIGTIEEVEDFLGIPVLGVIPDLGKDKIGKGASAFMPKPSEKDYDLYVRLISHFAPKSILAESYRSLRTNIEFLAVEKLHRVFLFTSSALREGKTNTVVNLATVLAQMGRKVILIDADLRKPAIHNAFGLDIGYGLSEIIMGSCTWQEATRTATDIMLGKLGVDNLMITPGLDNVNIITSGTIPPNPAEFLHSPRLDDLINDLRKEYDIVIIDTPPVLPITDAMIMADKVDGIIIVYQVGRMSRSALKRSKLLLENVGGNLMGVVLSGVRAEVSPDYTTHSHYYYGTDEDDDIPVRLMDRFLRKCKTWTGR